MKNLILPLLLLGLLTSCGKTEAAESTPVPEETAAETEEILDASAIGSDPVYVSLGDSIARGYGLADPAKEAYSAVLSDAYKYNGGLVALNFGVDGQDSTELVSYIANNPDLPEAIADADYVSVSIGANNFLGDAFTFLGTYHDFKANPSTTLTSEDITAAFQQFNADVSEGMDQLREDLPQIIDGIRSSSEDCEILFLTCYNPYGAVNVTLDWGGAMPVNFAALSDTCVTQMNDIIKEYSAEYGYTVADVYTAFDGKADRLVNASPVESGDTFDPNAIDPHPNKNGHKVIADVLLELIKD